MEKENLELATQLAKKEAELDVKTQEKEDVEANLERTKVLQGVEDVFLQERGDR